MHLIHAELFEELASRGFAVSAGALGENITTRGIALLDLPVGTELRLGDDAVIRLTGLRNPCGQLDEFQNGLMSAVLGRTPEGKLIRKAGVMGIVVASGTVAPGDAVTVTMPTEPHCALERV